MNTPNGEYFRNPLPKFSDCPDPSQFESIQLRPDADGHIFLLHEDEILPLAEASGLIVKEIKFFTNPLTNGFLKTELLLKITPEFLVNAIETLTAKIQNNFVRKLNVQMLVTFEKPAGSF
jgi:hypothetical protein